MVFFNTDLHERQINCFQQNYLVMYPILRMLNTKIVVRKISVVYFSLKMGSKVIFDFSTLNTIDSILAAIHSIEIHFEDIFQ